MQKHKYPREIGQDGNLTERGEKEFQDLLEKISEAIEDQKAAVVFWQPLVVYKKGTITRIRIDFLPEDSSANPEVQRRALGFLGKGA